MPVFGLLPVGVNTNQGSFEQTGAANVASAIVADLRATALTTPPSNQYTPRYQILIPGSPSGTSPATSFFVREDGTLSGTMGGNADPTQSPHYRITLSFVSTGSATSSTAGNPNATAVRVFITWPALADAAAATVPSKFSGSFETFTGLVHN